MPPGPGPFPPPDLPPPRELALPGRGTTSVREVAGPPGAPTVVLLHGWTANAAVTWYAAFGPLGRRFRVLAPDHRGHGAGLRHRGPFRLEDCADDVAALTEVLGTGPVVAVGYSMGGPVAQLLWRRHPDRVAGLVLCATARNFVGGDLRGRAWQQMMTGLSVATRATPPALRARLAQRATRDRFDDTPLGRWAADEARAHDVRALVEAGRELSRFSSRDWVGQVDVPTAVVVTDGDEVVPPARQLRLARSIPGASARHVAGGHDVCATDPGAFVPALVAACTEVAVDAGVAGDAAVAGLSPAPAPAPAGPRPGAPAGPAPPPGGPAARPR